MFLDVVSSRCFIPWSPLDRLASILRVCRVKQYLIPCAMYVNYRMYVHSVGSFGQAKKAAKEAQKERRKTKIKKHVKQQRIKHTSGSKKK